MSIQQTYYLPISETFLETVLYSDLAPKTDGIETNAPQKIDKEGLPVWTLSALVKVPGGLFEGESFTLSATKKTADEIMAIKPLTQIKLLNLKGGKWSKNDSVTTKWSFLISGIKVAS